MEVRILPMSFENKEFVGKSVSQIQEDFFMYTLPIEEKGWYYYERQGLDAQSGDLILFQMNDEIIASAFFHLNLPNSFDKAFKVQQETIRVFKPITYEELSCIISNLHKFDRIKRKYDVVDVDMKQLCVRMNVPIR